MKRMSAQQHFARYRRIVAARLANKTLAAIGAAEGISKERVRQLAFQSQRYPELRAKGVSGKYDREHPE